MCIVIKNLPANAGDVRDMGSIPGSGRSPGGKHGNSLQYSCPENPVDRGAFLTLQLQGRHFSTEKPPPAPYFTQSERESLYDG